MNPRILVYDIETSPIIGYTWGVWQTNVIDVISDWQILTVAWKWLGESKTYVIGQDDFKGYKPGTNNDKKIVEKIHELFCEADIVIAHNGNSFDQKKVRARMIAHGMTPPSPYKEIDTKLEFKRVASFTRNNLKHLANDLETKNRKGDAGGFETWQGCLAGDKKAWKLMKKYNKQDIATLEDLYLRIRPWMKSHPHIGNLTEKEFSCPKCGSQNLQFRGYQKSQVATYHRAQCQDCGGWMRERLSDRDIIKPVYTNA